MSIMDYKRKTDNLIMMCKGFGKDKTPYPKPKDTELWSINDLIFVRQDIDLLWEMHLFEAFSKDQLNNVILADKLGIPVMMPQRYEGLLNIIKFPLKEMILEFKSDYFSTAIAEMMAFAIHLGYKRIDCYGCNMAGISETYKNGKASFEYWLGVASGRGIEVNLHGKYNQCLKTYDRRIYGYENLFQWIPEDITDKSLYLTFGCSLSGRGSFELFQLLNEQTNSTYYRNYKNVPYIDINVVSNIEQVIKRRLIEDAIKFNVDMISTMREDQPKFVGDVAFFYLPYYDRIMVVNHSFKIVYITDDINTITDDWMTFSSEYNFWTDPRSPHWDGHKLHPQFDQLFPKYNLPKEEALKAYYEFYHEKAVKFQKDFPKHILIEDRSILNTREGQKKILNFIGYKEDEMVTTA